jgi:hypothetical protein
MGSPGCIDGTNDYMEYVRYSVTLSSQGPSEVFVPVPECGPVLDRLKVVEGEGEFELVDSVHGPGMRVSTGSVVTVRGTWHPGDTEEMDAMTINLTTMDPNETEPYGWLPKVTEVPDRSIWINRASGQGVEISLYSSMMRHDLRWSFTYSSSDATIDEGWSQVLAIGASTAENI